MKSIKIFIFLLFLGWATPIFGGPDIDEYIDSIVKVEFKNRTATGFLISKEGYILTCGHVFEGYDESSDGNSIKRFGGQHGPWPTFAIKGRPSASRQI